MIPYLLTSRNKLRSYDFIYFRYAFTHPLYVFLVNYLKHRNPKLKTLLEFPTYPYQKESHGIFWKLIMTMDQLFFPFIKNKVDRIVHFGGEEKIKGIQTICIRNGIAVDQVPLIENFSSHKKLSLIALGQWNNWHGMDRIIRGLKAYYENNPKRKVTLMLVGDGPALKQYQELVEGYKLNAYVKFFPPTYGADLNKFFEQSNIAIGNLAIHRKGVTLDSSLKHRVYCARSIPFIFASQDPDFPEQLPFIQIHPANEDPLEIEKLLIFYDRIKGRHPQIKSEMRIYAEQRIDWTAQIKPIISWLET